MVDEGDGHRVEAVRPGDDAVQQLRCEFSGSDRCDVMSQRARTRERVVGARTRPGDFRALDEQQPRPNRNFVLKEVEVQFIKKKVKIIQKI